MKALRAHQAGDWFADVRAQGVARVAQAFGLELGGAERARWLKPCLACGAGTRHPKRGDKRGAVGVVKDGRGWVCFECEAKGDAVTLAALGVTSAIPAKGDKRWADVRRACAERGWCDADPRDGRPAPTVRLVKPPPMPALAPPSRLPSAEVAALWAASAKLDAMPRAGGERIIDARTYFAARGFHPGDLALLDVARVLPATNSYAWPSWWPSKWSEVWRVAVPLYDASGAMVALQARAIAAAEPKTRNPMGVGVVSGTFFADAGGLEVLRGTYTGPGLVVVEGLTDYLAAAQLAAELEPRQRPAVLGIMAGSSKALATVNVKTHCRLVVITDNDAPGEKYFSEVKTALPGLEGFRVRLRPLDGKRADLSDYLRHHKDTARAALTHGMKEAPHGG